MLVEIVHSLMPVGIVAVSVAVVIWVVVSIYTQTEKEYPFSD